MYCKAPTLCCSHTHFTEATPLLKGASFFERCVCVCVVDVYAEEREKEEKERKEEEDDEEAIQKARDWDNWKDTHRRGYGNRQNMG